MHEVILVAGLNKTGTQSLQKTCAANQEALLRQGLGYPLFAFTDSSRAENHNFFLAMAFARGRGSGPAVRAQLQQRLAAAARNTQRLLLVAPEVSRFKLDEFAAIQNWADLQGARLRVLCSVRHLSSWVHSFVAQRVTGSRRQTIEQVIDEFRQHGFVQKWVANIISAFPTAEFRSFEADQQHPHGPVAAVLGSIGVQLSGICLMRANEGSSDAAVRALSAHNACGGPADATTALARLPGAKFRLRADELDLALQERLAAENEWLGRTLGAQYRGPPVALAPASTRPS